MCGTQKTSFDVYRSYLAVQNGSFRAQLIDDLAFNFVNFLGVWIAFISTNPSNISHCRVQALNVELILETDWKTMQDSNWFTVLGKISV